VPRDLARPAHALRLDRGIGQHGLGHDVVRPAGSQQVEHADHPLAVLGGVLGAAEALWQEGSHQREATSGEARPQLLRVAEVAGRPELRAGIAGRRHLVQHLLRLELQGVILGLLEDPPRARGCRDLDAARTVRAAHERPPSLTVKRRCATQDA
jgi:hypothetical protein